MILTGHITPADKAASDYFYVPFDAPPGTTRLDVNYDYGHRRLASDLHGVGNTIDIGVFDARGHEFLKSVGFRGWSGSDRSLFFIAEDGATPGYLAGPIYPGRWHIILGLYHVADEGCDYTITIEFTSERISHERQSTSRSTSSLHDLDSTPAAASAALLRQPRWYRGDLQCHTHHSDAKGSLAALVETARTRGLDFLAVTDHNTVSHHREFEQFQTPDFLLIRGEEVTTYYGHMNVWGVPQWIDFRCRDAATMHSIIAEVHRLGGLASVNHPKTSGPPWEFGSDLDFDCIEAWQAPWPFHNRESFFWWESLLTQGRRVVAVGGSDYHQPVKAMQGNPHLLGHPTTWVYAQELSERAILDGIRRGHAFISADVDGPRLELTATDTTAKYMMGDVIEAEPNRRIDFACRVSGGEGHSLRVIADGQAIAELPVTSDDWTHTWSASSGEYGYTRAEVIQHLPPFGADDWMMLACANPIWLRLLMS